MNCEEKNNKACFAVYVDGLQVQKAIFVSNDKNKVTREPLGPFQLTAINLAKAFRAFRKIGDCHIEIHSDMVRNISYILDGLVGYEDDNDEEGEFVGMTYSTTNDVCRNGSNLAYMLHVFLMAYGDKND